MYPRATAAPALFISDHPPTSRRNSIRAHVVFNFVQIWKQTTCKQHTTTYNAYKRTYLTYEQQGE